MKYRVKLYGHLSDDKESFSHGLAHVLNTDKEDASALIRDVPVVILSGASKREADRMARDLSGIHALFLIEPEGQEPEPPRKPLPDIPPERNPEEEETRTRHRGYMGLTFLLGGLTVVLVVGSFSFFSLFSRIRTEYQAPVAEPKIEEPSSAGDAEPRAESPSAAAIQGQIQSLESRNEQLKSLMKLKQDEVTKGTSSFQMDFEGVRRSRQELGELHDEMRANLAEIGRLQQALARKAPQSNSRFK